jgi:lipooligosaccharide transport system ATP-binding protein
VDVLVEAVGLTKRYPPRDKHSEGFTAVDGIDLTLHRGELFGFLGPNGAGKSSTMRMLACISPVTAGVLRVLGMDPAVDGRKIRSRLGVVPQDDALDSELNVLENLQIYGRYFGLSKAAIAQRSVQLLEFAELTDRATDRVDALSGGMRRRLTIARALINSPELLLLDEPTTGLDPQARHLLWDRLFVIDRGVIVAHGSPRELIDRHTSREVLELRFDAGTELMSAEKIRAAGIGDRTEVLAARLLCSTDDGEAALGAVHRLGISPIHAVVRRSTLEDVFLSLTGRTLVD